MTSSEDSSSSIERATAVGRVIPTCISPSDKQGLVFQRTILSNLTPEINRRLDTLTRVADLLGIDDLSFSRLYTREQDARHTLNRLELVERELQSHLETMMHEERLIESWIERLDTELATGESTSTIEGRRETLLKKAKEYRATLDTIVASIFPMPRTRGEHRTIKAKRAKIKAFKGLPPNLDLARQQLRTARAAQMDLIQLRERLLGRMADSVV
ncbi:hypothetical protein DFH09DRAFT_1422388 [Mycena vulgaris]|nr:hypothetical protein DFH09DRAFT_1422388 [Mycena vulgaris]